MAKKYELTPEHRARFDEWRDRWIANAMSTAAMTEDDREACREAVVGMYAAAKLPPPKHIVFVPSPFVLAFAGGFSAAIWYKSGNTRAATGAATRAATGAATGAATEAATEAATWDATRAATGAATEAATRAATRAATGAATGAATEAATGAATRDATEDATGAATEDATWDATEDATWDATGAATRDATEDATEDATWDATGAATRDATEDATGDATRAATWDATEAATEAATRAATRAATGAATEAATEDATWDANENWYFVPADMRRIADQLGIGDFGLQCAAMAYRMWQGGNQWSGYDAYLSFFQDIAQLPLDYSSYSHWRTLAERSGPRIMHPDFCMISDRPELLMVDDSDRPHAENGPFCRWRDGTALYSWHGTRIPARWIERRGTLDPNEVIKAANVEWRAAGAAIVGWPKMLSVLKAKVVDDSGSPDIGQLIELKLPGLSQPGRFLKAQCPRNSTICEGVPRIDDYGEPIETALHSQALRIWARLSEYVHPEVRS
jgi:hypothetical protein